MDKQLRRSSWFPAPDDWPSTKAGVIAVITADDTRRTPQRDKLTIAEVCADLGISRSTFYEWRAKNGSCPPIRS